MIKSLANYLFWRLGVRKILPHEYTDRVVIEENGEELVRVEESTRLKISKNCPNVPQLRKEVSRRLTLAADNLPEGYQLILIEGFRSVSRQQELWDTQRGKVKEASPTLADAELDYRTRLFVAKPGRGGHQTGGAVDITLGNENGEELFLGTKMHEFSTKTLTDCRNISPEAKKLRQILLQAMASAGLVNYPAEWWHFSYGDKLWAAYSQSKKSFYGPI